MELAQLAVFARPPATGTVKTRLESAFGERGAAALYEAFVADTLELCVRVREAGRVAVELWTSSIDDPVVVEWGRQLGTVARLQPEGDLGVRLGVAFDEGLRRYQRVVIIGSDAPTLPLGLIASAFAALDDAPMALGPSNDGGYYAIGATHLVRPRFEGVRWSTTHALEDTVRANRDLELAMLSPWYDIDEPADVDVLRAHLSSNPKAAPATARVLTELAAAKK